MVAGLEYPFVASQRIAGQPLIAALLDYWEAKRGDRPMPDRRDIDPAELPPKLLPHLLLGETLDGGTRWRYRLVGTEIVRRLGFDPTGRYIDDVLGGSYLAYVERLNAEIYRMRCPVYSESLFRWDERRHLFTRRLWLPLTRNGADDVAIVLAAQTFEAPNGEPCEPLVLPLDRAHIDETGRARLIYGTGPRRDA